MSEPLPDETLAAIRANAEMAIQEFAALAEFAFGFDENSVAWLDGFIERERGRGDPEGAIVSVLGSYLGEAIIAAAGGAWAFSDHGIGVRFANGDWCYPFAKVAKQFENGAEGGDSILGFYRVAVQQVATGALR